MYDEIQTLRPYEHQLYIHTIKMKTKQNKTRELSLQEKSISLMKNEYIRNDFQLTHSRKLSDMAETLFDIIQEVWETICKFCINSADIVLY